MEIDEPPAPGLVELARSRDLRGLRDAALVLSSQGIPHDVVQAAGALLLVVPAPHAEKAREQLRRYLEENRHFRPREDPVDLVTDGVAGALGQGLVLALAFGLEKSGAFGLGWWEAGISDSRHLGRGEWWRAMTSLFLHSDAQHLLGNVLFGALFGALVAQLLGNGIGWLAVLLSGFLGNLLNAAVHPDVHRSVGASTSVFGALAVLVGFELVRRKRARLGFVRRWAPLLFGTFLLAWLGFGGSEGVGRTDVMAHVLGFAAGLVLGALIGLFDKRWDVRARRVQLAAGGAIALLVLAAWTLALRPF